MLNFGLKAGGFSKVTFYLSRDLVFTAALFTMYLVMIVIGYRSWRASMVESRA